jgi:hypothetical protein
VWRQHGGRGWECREGYLKSTFTMAKNKMRTMFIHKFYIHKFTYFPLSMQFWHATYFFNLQHPACFNSTLLPLFNFFIFDIFKMRGRNFILSQKKLFLFYCEKRFFAFFKKLNARWLLLHHIFMSLCVFFCWDSSFHQKAFLFTSFEKIIMKNMEFFS